MLEIYVVAKRSADYNAFLKARHTYQRDGSMEKAKGQDGFATLSSQMACAQCKLPWSDAQKKCLNCKSTEAVNLSAALASVIEVDGHTWQLTLTDSGPTWVPFEAQPVMEGVGGPAALGAEILSGHGGRDSGGRGAWSQAQ
eukprot:Skav232308  [mRNA]  locus=scaffold882:631428:631850:- [translate_table: standard]